MVDQKNAAIGRLMDEHPDIYWAVMNTDESAYCMSFDRTECANPKREAEEWFARHQKDFPGDVERNGYHVVRCERWSDYLGAHGECAATTRFINWGIQRIAAAGPVAQQKFFCSTQSGKRVQEAISDLLFGEDETRGLMELEVAAAAFQAAFFDVPEIQGEAAYRNLVDAFVCGEKKEWALQARVWRRDSTNEWVLEIDGDINGTQFTSRHTEPLSVAPEDVAGLPSLYAAIDQIQAPSRANKVSEEHV